jgi:hypothetical protein
MATEYQDIRKGVTKLLKANTMLLDGKGELQNRLIGDTMIDSTQDGVENYFKAMKLPDNTSYDFNLMARIIADAALVDVVPANSVLFLEGLMLEGQRISGEKNTQYHYMADEERLKLAAFLYRPAEERPLTYDEWWHVLFPTSLEDIKDSEPFDVKPVNERGLRKMLRCALEYGSGDFPDYGDIKELWANREWMDFTEKQPAYVHRTAKGDDFQMQVTMASPHTDRPEQIENMLVDIINFCRGSNDSYCNLDDLFATALQVLKSRKELLDHDYFTEESKQSDRFSMIQKVLDGTPLW